MPNIDISWAKPTGYQCFKRLYQGNVRMIQVVVIGCGVVGAAIAYELSQVAELTVTVIDRQPPAQASTGAALGVLMGVVSQKVKGNAWAMRHASMQRYSTLIPELEALTERSIPVNRQGILLLQFADDLTIWETLAELRHQQGWQLELWSPEQVSDRCPHIATAHLTAAVYSPQDCQVDPTALTLALVAAAQQNGVEFDFNTTVTGLSSHPIEPSAQPPSAHSEPLQRCCQLYTNKGSLSPDWVVVSAGLGSTHLLQSLSTQPSTSTLQIRPVLGQAVRLKLDVPLGDRTFQPVITGNDIHLVPLGNGEYWVGATVEFPPETGDVTADPAQLERVMAEAIALCPALANATILKTWSGLRPRPQNRPAPVVERLTGYKNVILATGHYRNGVLLAPATAEKVKGAIVDNP